MWKPVFRELVARTLATTDGTGHPISIIVYYTRFRKMLGHLLKWDDTTIRFIPLVHWLSRNTKIRTRSSRVRSVQATSVLCRPLSSIERCLFLAWNYERFSVKHLTSFIKRIFENKFAKTGPLFWAKVLSSLTQTFYFPSKKMKKKISPQSS